MGADESGWVWVGKGGKEMGWVWEGKGGEELTGFGRQRVLRCAQIDGEMREEAVVCSDRRRCAHICVDGGREENRHATVGRDFWELK